MQENVDYIEFLENEQMVRTMGREYEHAINKANSVTKICTIVEQWIDKDIKSKKAIIFKMLKAISKHSLYARYAKEFEKLLIYETQTDQKLDFYIGKNYIKTLHKIERIYQSIIMELNAIRPFIEDKDYIFEITNLLQIRKLIIVYYLDNDIYFLQSR